jgi:hypothetical protein
MKKFLCVIACVFTVVSALWAEEAAPAQAEKFSLNFVSGVSSPGPVDGARLNIIYGRSSEVKGLSAGTINVTDGLLKGAEFGFVNISGSLSGYSSGFVNMTGAMEGCQSGFINKAESINGVMSGFVNTVSGGTTGALLGFVNSAKGVTGLASGFVNAIDGPVNGCASGFINLSKDVNGSSLGFVNLSDGAVTGLNAGFVNAARSVKGVQAGFVNMADKNEGLMSGFVNVSGGLDGVALGMVNIIKGGFGKVSVYSSVETLYNVAFKSGKTVYGVLGVGYDHRDKAHSDKYVSTAGIGIHADLKPFFVDIEALGNCVPDYDKIGPGFDWKKDIKGNSELRLLPGIKVLEGFEIYGGPSLKYYYTYEDLKNHRFSWDNYKLSAVAGVNISVF